MPAKSHLMSTSQLDCSSFRCMCSTHSLSNKEILPAEPWSNIPLEPVRPVIDVGGDVKGLENLSEVKGLCVHVDIPFYPLEGSHDFCNAGYADKFWAVSMENSGLRPTDGLLPLCTQESPQRESCANSMALELSENSCAGVQSNKTSAGHKAGKRLISTEEPYSGMKYGMEQICVEAKGELIDGSHLYPYVNQVDQDLSHQQVDRNLLGKRPYMLPERESPQQKKLRPNATKASNIKQEKDEGKRPASKVLKKSVTCPIQWKSPEGDSMSKERINADLGTNVEEPTVLLKARPKSRFQDITKEEAALELRQCVSLLKKYGVLNTREFYLSQTFPRCAPHPGYAGDKFQSKRCKICRVLEDANNTVICDECQEAFHLSCCLPRLNLKHFDREDDWFCGPCKKQKRRMGNFNSFRYAENGHVDGSGKAQSAETSYNSKVRLGRAHQADVPLWAGKVDNSPTHSTVSQFGMEKPLSEEEKEGEKVRLLKEVELKIERSNWQPVKLSWDGTRENWLKCHNVAVPAFKDSDGNKHSEIMCDKWRRAPLDMKESDQWECFCVIEWDPLHADCAAPQELPTEEILRRVQVKSDPSEVVADQRS